MAIALCRSHKTVPKLRKKGAHKREVQNAEHPVLLAWTHCLAGLGCCSGHWFRPTKFHTKVTTKTSWAAVPALQSPELLRRIFHLLICGSPDTGQSCLFFQAFGKRLGLVSYGQFSIHNHFLLLGLFQTASSGKQLF